MSTTLMTDAMVIPPTELPPATATARSTAETTEVESVKCDCCGLTEECTLEYIERIRERYLRQWICGLCAEAVKDEIVRSKRLITTEEAMARHVAFCRTPISSGPSPDPTVHLIATVRQILRRSLESPTTVTTVTTVKSVPCSPTVMRSGGAGVTRSESCMPDLTLVVDCSSNRESDEDDE